MGEFTPTNLGELFAKELEVFDRILPTLLETDYGRWALIKDSDFIGAYDTEGDAIATGYRDFGNVPFFTRQILNEQPVINMSYAEAA